MIKKEHTGPCLCLLLIFLFLPFPSHAQPSEEVTENAAKYHGILKKRPGSGYLFDRFYSAWLDTGSLAVLEEFLTAENAGPGRTTADALILGFYHAKQGNDQLALDTLAQALETDPEFPAGWLEKAKISARNLNYQSAIADLDQALKTNLKTDQRIEIVQFKGRLLVRSGKNEDALALWKQLLSENPGDEELHEDLVELQIDEGLFEEAIDSLRALIAKTRDPYQRVLRQLRVGDVYQRIRRRQEALAAYEAALRKTGRDTWIENETLAQIERVYRRADDLAGLAGYLDALASAEGPERPALVQRLARVLVEVNQADRATRIFAGLVSRTPGSRPLRQGFIDLLSRSGEAEKAAAQMEEWAEQDPEDTELLIRLSELQHQAGRTGSALSSLETYLEKAEDREQASLRVARIQESFGKIPEAEATYRALIANGEVDTSTRETFASFLHRTDRKEEAVSLWKELAASGDREQVLRTARALSGRRAFEAAFEVLRGNYESLKQDPVYLAKLCEAAIRLETYDQAVEWALRRVERVNHPFDVMQAVEDAAMILTQAEKAEKVRKKLDGKEPKTDQERCLLAELLQIAGETGRIDEILKGDSDILLSQRIRMLKLREDWKAAAEATAKLLAASKTRTSPRLREVTELYRRAKRPGEAAKWLPEWKRIAPGSSEPWVVEATIFEETNQKSEALGILKLAARKFPDDLWVRDRLARMYLKLGKKNDARRVYFELYEASEELTGKLTWVSRMAVLAKDEGKMDQLIDAFRERHRKNRQSVAPLFALAEIHRRNYDFEERRKALMKASRLRARDVDMMLQIARIEDEEDKGEDALKTLDRALAVERSPRVLERITALRLKYGDPEQGYRVLYDLAGSGDTGSIVRIAGILAVPRDWREGKMFRSMAAAKELQDKRIHFLMGIALEELSGEETAIESYLAILGAYRRIHERKAKLARYTAALQKAGRGSSEEETNLSRIDRLFRAEKNLIGLVNYLDAPASAETPERPALVQLRARTLFELKKTDQAIEVFAGFLSRAPGNRPLREDFIELLKQSGQKEMAVAQMEQLVKQTPAEIDLLLRLAKLQKYVGWADRALATLETYLAKAEDRDQACRCVARTLESFGMIPEAEATYRTLIDKEEAGTSTRESFASFLHRHDRKEEAVSLWKALAASGGREQVIRAAHALSSRGEVDAAFEALRGRYESLEHDSGYFAKLRQAARRLGKDEQAAEWALRRVERVNQPVDIEQAVNEAATLLTRAGKAQAYAEKLATGEPLTDPDRCLLAELLEQASQHDRVDEILEGTSELILSQRMRIFKLRGDWASAAKTARALLPVASGARKPSILRDLVAFYRCAQRPDEGGEWLPEWKAAAPAGIDPWLIEAVLLEDKGDFEGALTVLESAALRFENDPAVLGRLAAGYRRAGRHAEVRKIYTRFFDEAETLSGKMRWVPSLVATAKAEGKIMEFIDRFEGRRRNQPGAVAPLLALAEIHGRYSKVREMSMAMQSRPRDVDLMLEIARFKRRHSWYDEAEELFHRAYALDDSPRVSNSMASFRFQGLSSWKKDAFRTLKELGSDADADNLVLFLRDKTKQPDWQELNWLLSSRIDEFPDDYRLHYLHGTVLEELSENRAAAECFLKVLGIARELPSVLQAAVSSPKARPSDGEMSPELLKLTRFAREGFASYCHRVETGNRLGVWVPRDLRSAHRYALAHLSNLSLLLKKKEATQEVRAEDPSKEELAGLETRLNRYGIPMTREGIQDYLQRIAGNADSSAAKDVVFNKRISVTAFRAIELLKPTGLTEEIFAAALRFQDEPRIVRAAGNALSAVVTKDDIPFLSSHLIPGAVAPLREICMRALRRLEDATLADRFASGSLNPAFTEATRLESALALADLGDRRALNPLAELMAVGKSPSVRACSAAAMRKLTGRNFTYSAYARSDPRTEQADRWKQWIAAHGKTARLAYPLRDVRLGYSDGLTPLLAGGKVVKLDQAMNEVWRLDLKPASESTTKSAVRPVEIEGLEGGHVLVVDYGGNRVLVVNPEKKIVWEYPVKSPRNARALRNGNFLITASPGVMVEINPDGETVWEFKNAARNIFDAFRLENGHILVRGRGKTLSWKPDFMIEYDDAGTRLWERSFKEDMLRHVDLLEDGNLLLTLRNRFFTDYFYSGADARQYEIIDKDTGNVHLRFKIDGVRAHNLTRLENGNWRLLIYGEYGEHDFLLIEWDEDGEVVKAKILREADYAGVRR